MLVQYLHRAAEIYYGFIYIISFRIVSRGTRYEFLLLEQFQHLETQSLSLCF
jgi:hypothetical protein